MINLINDKNYVMTVSVIYTYTLLPEGMQRPFLEL